MPAARRLTCEAGAVSRSLGNRYQATVHPVHNEVLRLNDQLLFVEMVSRDEPYAVNTRTYLQKD